MVSLKIAHTGIAWEKRVWLSPCSKEVAMRFSTYALIILLSTLPAASSARRDSADAETRLAKALEGLTPGKAVSCIDLRDAQGTEAIGDALLFRASRKLVYRSDTSGGCGHQAFGDTFITHTWGSQLCKGDVVRRADLLNGFQSGFCITGNFTPYRMP
jgi:hypothetical protein